jgi:hypothetical protein
MSADQVVAKMMAELATELKELAGVGMFRCDVYTNLVSGKSRLVLDVEPQQASGATAIRVIYDAEGQTLTASLGRHCHLELFAGATRLANSFGQIRTLARSVIEGGFSEAVYSFRGRPVKSVGRASPSGLTFTRWLSVAAVLPGKKEAVYAYGPYLATRPS